MSKKQLSVETVICDKCGSMFKLIRGEGEPSCPLCGRVIPPKKGGELIKKEVI